MASIASVGKSVKEEGFSESVRAAPRRGRVLGGRSVHGKCLSPTCGIRRFPHIFIVWQVEVQFW